MQERVLVEVDVGAPAPRPATPSPKIARIARPEDVGQVEVDRPDRAVEVDLLVQEQPGGEEHLERAQAGLVQGQPALADERVAHEPLDVDRAGRDAREVGVAADVVEVVDREHARQERLEPAQPAGHRRIGQGRLRDEERHPARVDRLAGREAVALGDAPGRAAQPGDRGPELALDDELAQVLVGEPLAVRPARVGRGREVAQHVVVEEVGERPMAHVVEQPGDPQRLDDEPLGRDRGRRSPARRPPRPSRPPRASRARSEG